MHFINRRKNKIMPRTENNQCFQTESDSFWEPRNYERTTKRIKDGYK